MRSGERQVAPTREGIRRDHTARYEWLERRLGNQPRSVLDVACGIGYGSQLLGQAGHKVTAIDCDPDAIAYARSHYSHTNVQFKVARAENIGLSDSQFNVAIALECIEHIADPIPVLRALRQRARVLFASVPNEEVFPWQGHAYHFRHYTREQFAQLLEQAGWLPVEWHGQEGPESEVEANVNGRTLIAMCVHASEHEVNEPIVTLAAKPAAPESVSILGLGPSINQYVELTKRLGGRRKLTDQVWSINALGDVFASDVVFHMDDVRIQQIRADARPESNIAALLAWLKTYKGRVITSRAHPDYPVLEAFPLEEVVNELGGNIYFNSTAAYAVAYAIWLGVKKIYLFGMDFTYPNAHDAEKGRACVEFWVGYAMARGVKVSMPQTSSLLDACYSTQDRFYGYDCVDVRFSTTGGKTTFAFVEKTTLPTADEIEHRYDHSRHPNALVEDGS